MLVFSRKVGEVFVLVIDGVVAAKIKLIGFNKDYPGQLKVGIDSPKEIGIFRNEVWEKINKGKLKV